MPVEPDLLCGPFLMEPDGSQEPLLAIATAGEGCIAALRAGGEDHVLVWPERRGMDGYLVPMLQELLRDHGIAWCDLVGIGVVTGPGSFTGLRIGLATAQGFGIALNVPVIGVSAFDMWRRAANSLNPRVEFDGLLIALNTLRDDAFCALYDGDRNGESIVGPKVSSGQELKHFMFEKNICGDAPNLPQRAMQIEPETLAKALLDITALADTATHKPEPLYLRAPEISAPRAA